ncbi:choice-of-anchor C family protein [Streptomyces albus]|uniref:choice-of-anchor C family protein n=1 Tax=Streptomyces albus TaxID=1888 RepID=UPI0006E1458D|nr:choice-of-anchor C family protein [Streptomyces albus]
MVAIRAYVTTVAAAGLLALAPGAALAAPTALDDGSFEYPVAPANSFNALKAGQTIGPWSVDSGSVDHIGKGFWQAADGDQSVDLNGGGPGKVSQTIRTTAGKTYTVSYALAGNPEGNQGLRTGRVLVDGQNFQDFSFDTTGKTRANMGYVGRQVTFVATGATTTLSFASTSATGAYGPVIDDVRVKSGCCSCSTCSD